LSSIVKTVADFGVDLPRQIYAEVRYRFHY